MNNLWRNNKLFTKGASEYNSPYIIQFNILVFITYNIMNDLSNNRIKILIY